MELTEKKKKEEMAVKRDAAFMGALSSRTK
jgi:hypothetical protein